MTRWQIAIMVKTQVQIPDELYHDTKKIAKHYEMSFAEVVRRGLEKMRHSYPLRKNAGPWEPPKPRKLGWRRDFSPEELKEIAQRTSFEEELMSLKKQKRR